MSSAPAHRPAPQWPAFALLALALLSAPLIFITPTFTGEDWDVIRRGAELALSGQSPFLEPKYRWSPVAAWLTAPLLLLPYWAWIALHVGAVLAFRDRWAVVIALVSWPFWQDAGVGNVLTFVVLAAWWALRGNRPAGLIYLAFCLLMPRPLMLPAAAWLLWKDPGLRLPFVAMLTIQAALALVTGHALEWLGVLAHAGVVDMTNPYAIGPSRLIGAAWLVIGIPLAAVLAWKGRVGLAGLAASPYWLPYYLLFPLLELNRPRNAAPVAGNDN